MQQVACQTNIQSRVALLRQMSIFRDVSDEVLFGIASELKQVDVKSDEVIFREGDTLVVHSMDRLARNLANLLTLVKDLTKRGGRLAASFPVEDGDEVLLVSDQGQLIRTPVSQIRIAGRNTQGVTIFRTAADEHVVSVERLAEAATGGGEEPDAEGETPGGPEPQD